MDDPSTGPNATGVAPPISEMGFAGTDDIFFAAVEVTRMPMIVSDPKLPDNPIVYANNAFLDLSGYTKDELLGRNCRMLQGPGTDRETVRQVRAQIAERRQIAVEILNYRKDGSTFWNALFISPVFGRDGQLQYFFASQLDVSRRRDAEDALRQSQKMEAIGQLTGGIAHDFNNLLTVIIGNLSTAISRGQLHPDIEKRISRALEGGKRAERLTQQLLAFARKQSLRSDVINLNSLIGVLTDFLTRSLGGNIQIKLDLSPNLPNTLLDATQMETALINVLVNARDAMPDGGHVTISTRVERAEAQSAPAVPPGEYVALIVEDTGQGMTEEARARALEPFFTTKPPGKGSGMGLSMVYGFVKQSGGYIQIKSAEGRGSQVKMMFPVAVEQIRAPTATDADAGAPKISGKKTILVVEDTAEVRELVVEWLRDAGYTVAHASSGDEALPILRSGIAFDMLFTDIRMPGTFNGINLAREAEIIQPGIRILLTTGYSGSDQPSELPFDVIFKPYVPDALFSKLADVFGPQAAD